MEEFGNSSNPRCEMNLSEATEILLGRIRKLEPEIGTKLMGIILMQGYGEKEMMRLACGPESLLKNLVQISKLQLESSSKSLVSTSSQSSPPVPINPSPRSDASFSYMPFSPHGSTSNQVPQAAPFWELPSMARDHHSVMNSRFPSNEFMYYNNPLHPVSGGRGTGSFPGHLYYGDGALSGLRSRPSPSFSDSSKRCPYFNKGFCKRGSDCLYKHELDSVHQMYSPNYIGQDDPMYSPSSLEKLDLEISELLKSRRGSPVSIASLMLLYQEKYGRHLEAKAYTAESQRHGRRRYTLTELLARLKRIRLIESPCGYQAVILAEDASEYNLDNRGERNDPGPSVSESREIYVTFPPESTFTKEDVFNYFNIFGAVEDVRLRVQKNRKFGFVTFVSANTAKAVLAIETTHMICGSRVSVQPCKGKSKLVDRKYMETNDHGVYYPGNYLVAPNFNPLPRYEDPRFFRRQLSEEQEQALEMGRRRLSELQSGHEIFSNGQFISYSMEQLNALEDNSRIPGADQHHYLTDVFNNCNITADQTTHPSNDSTDQERQVIDLPEDPFSSNLGNGDSTAN